MRGGFNFIILIDHYLNWVDLKYIECLSFYQFYYYDKPKIWIIQNIFYAYSKVNF